jgi:hypothetical protein
VEAAATQSWWKYVGSGGRVLGIDRFGASGKAPALFDHYRADGRARRSCARRNARRAGASGPAPARRRAVDPERGAGIKVTPAFVPRSYPIQSREEEKIMAIKVGINGYGRIGRNVLRALYEGGRTQRHPDRRHQ